MEYNEEASNDNFLKKDFVNITMRNSISFNNLQNYFHRFYDLTRDSYDTLAVTERLQELARQNENRLLQEYDNDDDSDDDSITLIIDEQEITNSNNISTTSNPLFFSNKESNLEIPKEIPIETSHERSIAVEETNFSYEYSINSFFKKV